MIVYSYSIFFDLKQVGLLVNYITIYYIWMENSLKIIGREMRQKFIIGTTVIVKNVPAENNERNGQQHE